MGTQKINRISLITLLTLICLCYVGLIFLKIYIRKSSYALQSKISHLTEQINHFEENFDHGLTILNTQLHNKRENFDYQSLLKLLSHYNTIQPILYSEYFRYKTHLNWLLQHLVEQKEQYMKYIDQGKKQQTYSAKQMGGHHQKMAIVNKVIGQLQIYLEKKKPEDAW